MKAVFYIVFFSFWPLTNIGFTYILLFLFFGRLAFAKDLFHCVFLLFAGSPLSNNRFALSCSVFCRLAFARELFYIVVFVFCRLVSATYWLYTQCPFCFQLAGRRKLFVLLCRFCVLCRRAFAKHWLLICFVRRQVSVLAGNCSSMQDLHIESDRKETSFHSGRQFAFNALHTCIHREYVQAVTRRRRARPSPLVRA